MNLEALALRRAEEQIACRGRDVIWNPTWKAARKPQRSRGTGPKPTCLCGSCRKCKNREWMRWYRHHLRHPKSERCSVDGCRKGATSGDYCARHAWQVRTFGVAFPNRRRVASARQVERARAALAAKGIAVEAA